MPSRIISSHTLSCFRLIHHTTLLSTSWSWLCQHQHCALCREQTAQLLCSSFQWFNSNQNVSGFFLASLRLPKPCFQSKGCKHLPGKSLEWQHVSQTQLSVCWMLFCCYCSWCLAAGYRLPAVSQGEQEHEEQQSLSSCTTSFTIHCIWWNTIKDGANKHCLYKAWSNSSDQEFSCPLHLGKPWTFDHLNVLILSHPWWHNFLCSSLPLGLTYPAVADVLFCFFSELTAVLRLSVQQRCSWFSAHYRATKIGWRTQVQYAAYWISGL